MTTTVYFDIIRDGHQGFSLLTDIAYILFILVLIAFIVYDIYKLINKDELFLEDGIYLAGKILFLGIILLFGFFITSYEKAEYETLVSSLKKKEYKIAEGTVKNVRVEYGKIDHQYFSIDNIQFDISDNISNGGFNKTILEEGPLYENRPVKIYYVENGNDKVIIRLELMR